MRLIYIAGAYRSTTPEGIQANIDMARGVAISCWRRGWAVICPHSNSGHMDGIVPDEMFLAGGLEILRRCDAIALVPGWQDSQGTLGEIGAARVWGLPIYEWPDVPEVGE